LRTKIEKGRGAEKKQGQFVNSWQKGKGKSPYLGWGGGCKELFVGG